WRTLGIEISPKMADFARREYGLEVLETSFLEAKLPSGEFDAVTMWGVLEHLHHPKAAVMEVHRLLRPAGLFVALVPNIDSTQFKLFGPQWPLLDVPRYLYHFSRSTLRRMVGEAGFQPVWTRFYAREHDLGNLIQSLEIVLLGRQRHLNQASSPAQSKWTTGRIAMGIARRLSFVIARIMALRQHSAAMEMYCIKTTTIDPKP
ncbi:MAG: class I SAM-dependent methyltransferase, partial [Armatimonadota bacterium]|nr:class I SAM-dependent methyltransferase [Armatimonadota bacterium]